MLGAAPSLAPSPSGRDPWHRRPQNSVTTSNSGAEETRSTTSILRPAPLGTDDEAADKTPAPAEVKLAYHREVGTGASAERKKNDDVDGVAIWVAVVLAWSTALFSAILFLRA